MGPFTLHTQAPRRFVLRLMKNTCIYLPHPLLQKIDKAAKRDDRSRSSFVRRALERVVADSEPAPRTPSLSKERKCPA
jgi:hypothetical protein